MVYSFGDSEKFLKSIEAACRPTDDCSKRFVEQADILSAPVDYKNFINSLDASG